MYEQYYGNEVALFNKEHKQRNPSAITTGLTYTPIPMITTGVDYRLGQQSQDEFKFTLNFRYELGVLYNLSFHLSRLALIEL